MDGKIYCFVTDDSADLAPNEVAGMTGIWKGGEKRSGLYPKTIPLGITYDDAEVPREVALNPREFYRRLEEGEYLPGRLRTASCTVADALAVLEEAIENSDEDVTVVYSGISSLLSSGTEAAAALVADELSEKYPGRFVYAPSYCISNGLGLMLQTLVRYEGDDVVSYARTVGEKMCHLFTVEDLSFAAQSGRFTWKQRAGQMLNSTLKVSPWMYFPLDANLQSVTPLARMKKIMERWARYYEMYAVPGTPVRIGYGGSVEEKRANELSQLMMEAGAETVQMSRISSVVGSHVGSSVISVFFAQTEVRDNEWHLNHVISK